MRDLPNPNDVDLAFEAGGLRPAGYRRGPVAYFYSSPSRHGPFHRIGSGRFKVSIGSFYARAHVYDPKGGYFLACTRTRVFPNMGRRFLDRSCGRATLR
jgi:hypothetical protein